MEEVISRLEPEEGLGGVRGPSKREKEEQRCGVSEEQDSNTLLISCLSDYPNHQIHAPLFHILPVLDFG